MKRPKPRDNGNSITAYKIKTNFDTYITTEHVSQDYISKYITYCLTTKQIPLSEIVFVVEPFRMFVKVRPLHTY